MIRAFHALRRHEEGQALVLAAISMLVLSLCLLATVNLTYAAKERIELQNTADAAAYSTAATQARALNFFAYTNRAMTVHYAADMNLLAVISYMAFSIIITGALSKIPWIGIIFQVINYIQSVYFNIIYVFSVLAIPFTDGINFGMSLMQTAVWTAMATDLLTLPMASVQQSNSAYQVDPLTNLLLNLTPAALGVNGVVNADPTPSLGTLTSSTDPNAVLNRLIMTEIANSSRNQWTAYGQEPPWISLGLVPRKIGPWSFSILGILTLFVGKTARTEWGSMQGGGGSGIFGIVGGLLGGIFNPTEQIFSDDRFEFKATLNLWLATISLDFVVETTAHADRNLLAAIWNAVGLGQIWPTGLTGPVTMNASFQVPCSSHVPWPLPNPCPLLESFIKPITLPLQMALNMAVQQATSLIRTVIKVPLFHFGQVPYARFKPLAHVGMQGRNSGLFNQPPVVLMVTAPSSYLGSRGQPFMGYFGARIGSMQAGQATHDGNGNMPSMDSYEASRNKSPSKRGFVTSVDFKPGDSPFAWMKPGFHAMSAAMAYYHRPGDWREPPNLFNPFWGAKLMPVGDYPSIQNSPLLGNVFTQNLLVH